MRKVRGRVYATIQDPDRVDDVVQETFVRAYRKLPPSFESVRHEAAWLCAKSSALAAPSGTPEPIVDETMRVLRSLTDDQRGAVLLVDLIGLDYESAAAALGVPRGKLAPRLHAARALLREALDV